MNNLLNDEAYLKLTIELAKKGEGFVSPNPLVGAVIVKDNKILSVGYHAKYGENHAEINALKSCKESTDGATMYVNLEPCSHYGKTPPCVNAIINSGIKRVVVGTLDPNPLVAGKGVNILQEAGIEVKTGVLQKECTELNKVFFKHITTKLPYVNLKIAQTIDAKIADKYFKSKWITSVESRTYVHELRSFYDAILVGKNTVIQDNPELTVRLSDGKNPYRVVMDTNCSLATKFKIFNIPDNKTIMVCSKSNKLDEKKIKEFENLGVRLLFIKQTKNGNLKLKDLLGALYNIGIYSVMVEGGARVFSSFIKKNLFDEINVFVGSRILGNGLSAYEFLPVKKLSNAINLKLNEVITLGDDVLLKYYRVK